MPSAIAAGLLAAWLAVGGCSPDGDAGTTPNIGTGSPGAAGDDGSATPVDPADDDGSSPSTPVAPTPDPMGSGNSMTGGGCEPGRYVGGFEGTYRSPADPGAGFLHLDLLIFAIDTESGPGLELTLEESDAADDCSLGSEFCADFVVRGGKMRGTANAYLFVNVDFEMDITGELDCSQGRFQGQIENGHYRTGGTDYYFSGTIQADYDPATLSFVNGSFEVQEHDAPPDLVPPPSGWGGEASWQASLQQ